MRGFNKKAKPANRIVRVIDKGSKEKVEKIKINKTLERDEEFYLECFNLSNHKCEECNAPLPDQFRDDNDRIIARYRYSHVIPKSIAPELRWKIENINHLCLECHTKWEHGDKTNMNIFTKNVENFPNYLSKFSD
jgi:5-methylcytosine-specific restriction endonuclease McrA